MKPVEEPIDFILTQEEKESRLWKRLAEYLEQRLTHARLQNDALQLENTTAMLRGRIAELRGLIGLSTKLPAVDEPPR